MRLAERWPCTGDTMPAIECGIAAYRAHPDAWWIVVEHEMIGPFDARSILRAVRVACTPIPDGCERFGSILAVSEFRPRRPLRKGPRWRAFDENELPISVTVYDRAALAPVSGCVTTFDALPQVAWDASNHWQPFLDQRPARGGRLTKAWNAHPAGSLLFAEASGLGAGFTIVDAPGVGTRTPSASS